MVYFKGLIFLCFLRCFNALLKVKYCNSNSGRVYLILLINPDSLNANSSQPCFDDVTVRQKMNKWTVLHGMCGCTVFTHDLIH